MQSDAYSLVVKLIPEKLGYMISMSKNCVGQVSLWICDVVRDLPEFFESVSLLITGMDSAYGSRLNLELLAQDGVPYQEIGKALFIASEDVAKFFSVDKWQIGYSEFYLIEPNRTPSTDFAMKFTSDAFDFSESVPTEFWDCFEKYNARRYLSDGQGLNYVCEEPLAMKLNKLASESGS